METEPGKLQLFSAGGVRYAILADDVITIAEWRQPAPLPHAPAAVLGVVSIHGRMLTVLDLTKLAEARHNVAKATHILALRGDEQLALAISEPGGVVEYNEIDNAKHVDRNLVTDEIKLNGADIKILNINELFSTAIQGRERRRRRF